MRSLALIAIVAGVACGEAGVESPLMHADELRWSTWGAACGPEVRVERRVGRAGNGVLRTWSSKPGSRPVLRCQLSYQPFGLRLTGLGVSASEISVERAQVVLDGLILRHLPKDVRLAARGIAMWHGAPGEDHQTARLEIVGGRNERDGSVELHVFLR